MSKSLVYDGPHAEVEVPEAGIEAVQGEPVEVQDDAVAKRLLEQDTWSEAKRDKPASKSKENK
jgi:hypothetical protein